MGDEKVFFWVRELVLDDEGGHEMMKWLGGLGSMWSELMRSRAK